MPGATACCANGDAGSLPLVPIVENVIAAMLLLLPQLEISD
jgi:hypothetical protein